MYIIFPARHTFSYFTYHVNGVSNSVLNNHQHTHKRLFIKYCLLNLLVCLKDMSGSHVLKNQTFILGKITPPSTITQRKRQKIFYILVLCKKLDKGYRQCIHFINCTLKKILNKKQNDRVYRVPLIFNICV